MIARRHPWRPAARAGCPVRILGALVVAALVPGTPPLAADSGGPPASPAAARDGQPARQRAGAADFQAQIAREVRLDQRLNQPVPPDVTFHDESGREVRLGDYFGRRPVMLNLIQYRCTMLCSEEMRILADSLKELQFTPGDQFTLLTVSIDPREQPDLALEYRKGYLARYARPGAGQGWHFLTGNEAAIRRLADSLGYHYRYDPATDQFAHPDGVIILTPAGKIARYFFRLQYPPRDLRLALVEAAGNRIGSPLDQLALLCYHYNPTTGTYGLALLGLVRLAGLATVVLLTLWILGMLVRDRRSRRARPVGARNSPVAE